MYKEANICMISHDQVWDTIIHVQRERLFFRVYSFRRRKLRFSSCGYVVSLWMPCAHFTTVRNHWDAAAVSPRTIDAVDLMSGGVWSRDAAKRRPADAEAVYVEEVTHLITNLVGVDDEVDGADELEGKWKTWKSLSHRITRHHWYFVRSNVI